MTWLTSPEELSEDKAAILQLQFLDFFQKSLVDWGYQAGARASGQTLGRQETAFLTHVRQRHTVQLMSHPGDHVMTGSDSGDDASLEGFAPTRETWTVVNEPMLGGEAKG